jgi:hypothetical protein
MVLVLTSQKDSTIVPGGLMHQTWRVSQALKSSKFNPGTADKHIGAYF